MAERDFILVWHSLIQMFSVHADLRGKPPKIIKIHCLNSGIFNQVRKVPAVKRPSFELSSLKHHCALLVFRLLSVETMNF